MEFFTQYGAPVTGMCIVLWKRIDPGTVFTLVKTAAQALVASFSSKHARVIARIGSEILTVSDRWSFMKCYKWDFQVFSFGLALQQQYKHFQIPNQGFQWSFWVYNEVFGCMNLLWVLRKASFGVENWQLSHWNSLFSLFKSSLGWYWPLFWWWFG